MTEPRDTESEARRERRRILRRVTLYTYGLLALAIAVAAAGTAIIAWFLSQTGVPFLDTWLVLLLIVLAVPLIGRLISRLRRGRDDEDGRDA